MDQINRNEDLERVVRVQGIVKQFPGVLANDHVNFDLIHGEVHALLGENGAGKSTLMNILSGLYKQDAGTIEVHGKREVFSFPEMPLAFIWDGSPAFYAGSLSIRY